MASRWEYRYTRLGFGIPVTWPFVVLGMSWVLGAWLLVAVWHTGVAANQAHNAPVCTAEQVFTDTYCYDTLDGIILGLNHDQADVDVGNRQLTASVALDGPVEDVRGLPVRVTVYQGKVVHIKGSGLDVDAQDAPGANFGNYLIIGLFCVIVGPVLCGADLLLHLRRRPPAPAPAQDSGSA